jgi:uncharacterized damage-inducible protein DinB
MSFSRFCSRVCVLLLALLFQGTVLRAEPAFEAAFRESLLRSFDEASGKIVRLAEAIPAERYGWRPMEGVSSVREVLVHVTATNYALGERLGTKAPLDRKGLDAAMQGKDEALAATRAGIAFIRGVLATVPAEALTEEVTVFGYKAPRLRVAFLPADHAHEHLGQLIAYARMNQVVPPWSK